jgi:MFS family permease
MLLLTTQFLQNVRGYPPELTGLMILPFSGLITIVSPFIGRLVGRFGARPLILFGLVMLMLGLFGLILGGTGSPVVVLVGLALCGLGGALCLTPITTLAMTSVPQARAGMASGIMSAQRAIGSTVGFAVLGSVLAAWLVATLDPDLATAVPDPAERRAIASEIVASANPRAHIAEIGPRHPITHPDPATQAAILVAAERDFIQGIRIALLVAIALLAIVFLAGLKWFPRGSDAMLSDAEREAAKLASAEP